MEKQVSEGSLHKWFKGSKSKDGKGGWVNVVTGGTCASDEPGEGTPKCVSSAKRASMTKGERLSASRRKKKAEPKKIYIHNLPINRSSGPILYIYNMSNISDIYIYI